MRPLIRKTYVFLSVLTLCLLTASILQEVGTVTVPEPSVSYVYVLREYEGKIALFAAGETQPLYVFEKETSNLPESDRAAIRTGILIENEDGLRRVMEDFFE